MSRPIYLSVDFDFFCREEEVWDWGHSEKTIFQEIAWQTRSNAFAFRGQDIFEETSLENYAKPHPVEFWKQLIKFGFTFDSCVNLSVADSHLWAAPDFMDVLGGKSNASIVNFDAHHDMGYQSWTELKENWLDPGRVDCSNWLLYLLYNRKRTTAAVVYPEWRGLSELNGKMPWKRNASITKRFQTGVYDEAYVRSLAGPVAGVFIAKSSAWTPPWHDRAFAAFVADAEELTRCGVETPYVVKEQRHPLDIREVDIEGMRQSDKQYVAMLNEWRAKNPVSPVR